jgi:hypothetical protein
LPAKPTPNAPEPTASPRVPQAEPCPSAVLHSNATQPTLKGWNWRRTHR